MDKMNQGPPSYTAPYPHQPESSYPQPIPSSYPQPIPPPYPQPQQTTIIMPGAFGKHPQAMTCPYCQATITTNVKTSPNTKTHFIALFLCVFLCWCCAPIPYCMDSCQVHKHSCPACKAYLGSSDN